MQQVALGRRLERQQLAGELAKGPLPLIRQQHCLLPRGHVRQGWVQRRRACALGA